MTGVHLILSQTFIERSLATSRYNIVDVETHIEENGINYKFT